MQLLIAITALAASVAMIFFCSIAASLVSDGTLRRPLLGTLVWVILSASAVALAFLSGRIWP